MDSTDRFTPVSADLFDVKDIIDNRQLLTSCTAAILLSFSLSYIVKDATDIFGLVTANTLITNRYVWNLITACFYETNPLKVFVDITLLLVGTRLTAVPSIEQFGLYFAFNVLACTIGTSAYLFVSFFATGKEELLITPHYGFGGVLMAVLMFARQQLRGVSIHSSIPRITYHNFPLIVISAKLILWIFLIETLSMDIYFSVIGFFFSWSYLRFYYRYQEHEPLGDSAEDFSFVAMFPEPLHIIMIPLSTAFYNLVALVGIYPQLEVTERRQYHHLRPVVNKAATDAPDESASTIVKDVISERRRAKAMKLLDAKMAELSQETEGWDDVGAMDDFDSLIPKPSELAKYKV